MLIGAVLRSILSGTKYPEALYQNTILRAKADQDNPDKNITKISRIKAAIIKACLIRNYKYNEEVITVALNKECKKVPYVLGRLFAVFEDLQKKANPGINSTIKDRYFNSACANPSMTFPLLTKLANTHLKKISSQKGTVKDFEKLIGALNGIKGVLNENFVNLDEVCDTKEKRDLLAITPAAALGSCRWKLGDPKENAEEFEEIIRILRKNDIGYFIYTGGNDSMDTVYKLSVYCEEHHIDDIKVMGAPHAIEPISGIFFIFGFGSNPGGISCAGGVIGCFRST